MSVERAEQQLTERYESMIKTLKEKPDLAKAFCKSLDYKNLEELLQVMERCNPMKARQAVLEALSAFEELAQKVLKFAKYEQEEDFFHEWLESIKQLKVIIYQKISGPVGVKSEDEWKNQKFVKHIEMFEEFDKVYSMMREEITVVSNTHVESPVLDVEPIMEVEER